MSSTETHVVKEIFFVGCLGSINVLLAQRPQELDSKLGRRRLKLVVLIGDMPNEKEKKAED